MGVPRLFPWLKKNFPHDVKHFQHGTYKISIDNMYLDANGLLHNAAQEVYNYGEKKKNIDNYKHLSDEAKTKKVFSLFFKKLFNVTQIVTPKKRLYIAIDGPAPLSKQNQQRERRFVAAQQRMNEEKKSGDIRFDSNCISPGTMFMLNLTRYINFAIRKEMNTYELWKNLNVYFSPPTVPGEGEHKCLDFIRELSSGSRNNESHCFFGPDGDLIMLSLAAHIPNIKLLRENQYEKGYYHLLNMGNIRRDLINIIPRSLKSSTLDDISDDFILAGFFVGNDFLPKIQMFHLLEEGLEFMLSSYQRTLKDKNGYLVKNKKINLKGFQMFVNEMAKSEEKFLIDQIKTKNPRKLPPGPEFVNHTLSDCIIETVDPSSTVSKYSLNMKKYRQDYYKKCNISGNLEDIEFKEGIKKLCTDYLKSFIWVYKYYVTGLPSWRWAYNHHYSPLMYDFNVYLQSLKEEEMLELSNFELQEPSLPFEQLLSILPPSSANLIPSPYRKLMLDPRSPLVKLGYYPTKFKIDYEGKLKAYQGITILPFVDYKEIHKNYIRMKECCTKYSGNYVRNSKGKVALFQYNPKYRSYFKSDMGNISNLHIKKTLL